MPRALRVRWRRPAGARRGSRSATHALPRRIAPDCAHGHHQDTRRSTQCDLAIAVSRVGTVHFGQRGDTGRALARVTRYGRRSLLAHVLWARCHTRPNGRREVDGRRPAKIRRFEW